MSVLAKPIKYNYKIQINYNDNTEYRECFRRIFRIDTARIIENLKQQHPDFDNYEDVTKDELIFDDLQTDQIMDEIMSYTKNSESFRELYKKAASFLISEELDIGLAVLLSYDYLQDFHIVLSKWFELLETCDDNISASELEDSIKGFAKQLRERLFR